MLHTSSWNDLAFLERSIPWFIIQKAMSCPFAALQYPARELTHETEPVFARTLAIAYLGHPHKAGSTTEFNLSLYSSMLGDLFIIFNRWFK